MNSTTQTTGFSVGFVLFVATTICIAALFWVGSGRGFLADHVAFQVYIPSTSGLRVGSKVYLSGVPVGAVSKIEFGDDLTVNKVLVTLAVKNDRKALERIREDSFVWLQTEGLLGDNSVHISMGTPEQPRLAEGHGIQFKGRSLLDDLAGEEIAHSASDLFENTMQVLRDINSGRGTIGQLLKNPELYNNLNEFTASMSTLMGEVDTISREMNHVLAEVKSQRGTLGKLIFSENYERKFSAALAESTGLIKALRVVAESVSQGKGSLGRMLSDEDLYERSVEMVENVAAASKRLNRIAALAESDTSVVGRLLADGETGEKLVSLVTHLERSAASLEKVLALLERGEGAIGMALHDPSLAIAVRDVLQGVREDSLVQGVVHRIERDGRNARLRDWRVNELERREARRARALADIGASERQPSRKESAQPVPAAATTNAAPRSGGPADPDDAEEQP